MHFYRYHSRCFLILVFTSTLLTGCMVGPNFHAPHAPRLERYNAHPLPKKTVSSPATGKGGSVQHFISAQDIPEEWWELFGSQAIDGLVRRGIANSPTLDAAKATLVQAQETLLAQIGTSLFPQVSAQFSATRQRFASVSVGSAGSSVFNLFNTSINVSYVPDVFGGARRQIESLAAQVDFQTYELIAAYLTLTSNIVTTAITTASLEAQIVSTKELIKAEEDQLVILNKQFKLGGIPRTTVYTQEVLVSQTKALLPALQNSLSQARHSLAVLVGTYPNDPMPVIKLKQLILPSRLPVTLPSCLVRQRPDVRASEALLHAATAQIGVATANLFPQFTLTGSYGGASDVLVNLLTANSRVWSMGLGLAQPIFQGGALLAKRRAAIAAYHFACAQYRQTVLVAFQNVADALRAIETDARTLKAQQEAETAAERALRLIKKQYFLGGTSYLSLLIAQQQFQQARITRIRAEGLRYADTAALFQALGGGWWHNTDLVCKSQRIVCIHCNKHHSVGVCI